MPSQTHTTLDSGHSTPPSDDEVLVRVEGVSKKFCRSLKKSLWYGVCDIAGELLPGRKRRETRDEGRELSDRSAQDISHSPPLMSSQLPSPLDARPSTPPSDDEVLVRVEGVSKKFCRSLKKSLWYGVCDIAGELLPGRKRQRVAGSELRVAGEEAEVAGSELLVASETQSASGPATSYPLQRRQAPLDPRRSTPLPVSVPANSSPSRMSASSCAGGNVWG